MPTAQLSPIRLARFAICAVLLAIACGGFQAMPMAAAPRTSASAGGASAKDGSRITSLAIAGSRPAGTFAGVAYRRVWGTVFGIVAPRDTLRGFDQLKLDDD